MQVQFGTDGKRINSTKIPTVAVTKTCVLKRPCTIENPVIDISDFVPQYSVAYIPAFGRYYHVTNIESISNSITRYYLTVDPLASHKNKILANRLYIARSESHGVKTQPDPYATHDGMTPSVLQMNFPFGEYSNNGLYVVQTAGTETSASIGESVNTYALTGSQLRNLITNLFTANTYDENGTPTVDGSVKTYFNPFQYIISCKWFPISLSNLVYTAKNIQFGWWDSGILGNLISGYTFSTNATIVLPAAVDWTYTSPEYSRYTISVPGIGMMEIDPVFAGHNVICQMFIDILTGNAKCELYLQEGSGQSATLSLIASASGYWGVDVLLTQLASDATSLASNVVQSASENVYGMDFASLITASNVSTTGGGQLSTSIGILESIPFIGSNFKKARTNVLQPALSMNGAVGDMTEFKFNPDVRLTIKHYDVLEPNMKDACGLPCNRILLLSTLSGYTICNNASIEIAGATENEKLAVKNMLEGGVYIE